MFYVETIPWKNCTKNVFNYSFDKKRNYALKNSFSFALALKYNKINTGLTHYTINADAHIEQLEADNTILISKIALDFLIGYLSFTCSHKNCI